MKPENAERAAMLLSKRSILANPAYSFAGILFPKGVAAMTPNYIFRSDLLDDDTARDLKRRLIAKIDTELAELGIETNELP